MSGAVFGPASILLGRDGCSCSVVGVRAQTLTRTLDGVVESGVVGRVPRNNKKFMQTLETETYHTISKEASQRGATVQELLRAVIIPEWLSENRKKWIK